MKPITPNFFQSRSLINSSKTPLTRAEKKTSKEAVDEAFKRSAKRGPVTWASFVLVALAGGGLLLYVRHLKEEKEQGEDNYNLGCIKDGMTLQLFSVLNFCASLSQSLEQEDCKEGYKPRCFPNATGMLCFVSEDGKPVCVPSICNKNLLCNTYT